MKKGIDIYWKQCIMIKVANKKRQNIVQNKKFQKVSKYFKKGIDKLEKQCIIVKVANKTATKYYTE